MVTLVEQLSVAVTPPRFVALSESPHSTVTLGRQLRTGGIVSSTVIVCVASAKLPQRSVTRYTRVTLPGQWPTNPLSLISAKVTELQASVAVPPAARKAARFVKAAGTSPGYWTEIFGQEMLGLVVSTTAMVWSPLVALPQASIAVQVRQTVLVPAQLLLTTSL